MINIKTVYTSHAESQHKIGLEKKLRNYLYNKSQLPKYIQKYIIANLSDLLIGEPKKLLAINKEFYASIVKGGRKKRFNPKIRAMFRYDLFASKKVEYNAYDLADNLKIDCCPNCNRLFTITITKKNKDGQLTRPDFDHYFPKSQYPLLALSFYNLIPSCKICNSTFKGDKDMDIKKHLHPYIDDIVDEFSFDFEPSHLNNNLCGKINIEILSNSPNRERIERTFQLFRLEEVYNGHKSIVNQVIRLKEELSDDYLNVLANTYKGILNVDEAYELGFGTSLNKEDFFKVPFSKLKKDITDKLNMIPAFS